MDYYETNQGSKIRVLLTDEELQLPVIDDLCNKYLEWLTLSKETQGGRKTRSANRKADMIYEEIMAAKLPSIKLGHLSPPARIRSNSTKAQSVESSLDSDSDSSSSVAKPVTRSLRSRSRTPTIQDKQPSTRSQAGPSTPANNRIRAYMKQPASGGSSSGNSSNVLSAALNQQHPSVSVTKIRQLLRADSAQKKRDEEKERHERLLIDRKAKEERAEAQKKQLLEERAINAKLKREQRLLHAAEVRKAREEAKLQQKLREEAKRVQQQQQLTVTTPQPTESKLNNQATGPIQHNHHQQPELASATDSKNYPPKQQNHDKQPNNAHQHESNTQKLNETFKKPQGDIDNIDISIQDETTEEKKDKIPVTASWARAPHIREALIKQFSKSESERRKEVLRIFPPVKLPVDLEEIFGPNRAAGTRYLCRTSSAVWSPPHRSMKRTSSMVLTPTTNEKH